MSDTLKFVHTPDKPVVVRFLNKTSNGIHPRYLGSVFYQRRIRCSGDGDCPLQGMVPHNH